MARSPRILAETPNLSPASSHRSAADPGATSESVAGVESWITVLDGGHSRIGPAGHYHVGFSRWGSRSRWHGAPRPGKRAERTQGARGRNPAAGPRRTGGQAVSPGGA